MEKFCGNCGFPMDAEGKCTNCGTVSAEYAAKKAEEQKELAQKKRRKIFTGIFVSLGIYSIVMITVSFLVLFDIINIPFINDIFIYTGIKDEKINQIPIEENEQIKPDDSTTDVGDDDDMTYSFEVTPPDADKYFEENATVTSEMSARDSANISSESDTYTNMYERGFTTHPIITQYDMDGVYSKEYEISSYSSAKHPMYQTTYITPGGDVWQILEVNGDIFAYPISYSLESENKVPWVISETSTITSYDSTKNKFYINTPNTTVMRIKTVARIDAETLNNITNGVLDE